MGELERRVGINRWIKMNGLLESERELSQEYDIHCNLGSIHVGSSVICWL